jgi:hypothetical protein
MLVSVNLIVDKRIPRSSNLLIEILGKEDKIIGVVGLIKGKDHISPLAQKILFQEVRLSFLLK